MRRGVSRRKFLAATGAAGVALSMAPTASAADKPALLGGKKARTTTKESWPLWDKLEEKNLLEALNSGHWFRGNGQMVNRFEQEYQKMTGAANCVATANGTSALLASLGALDIQAGDEVIVAPYTFIATVNVILVHHALPVFVDTDRESFQIDAQKIEAAITPRTKLILPVHLGGNVADLDAILAVAKKHNLPVVEDACQAHLAEWRNRKVGTWGATGCFSFQASKNLTAGEGGAILCGDAELANRCYAFHNNCRGRKTDSYNFKYQSSCGCNLRMNEWQGAILLAQMTRLQAQAKLRWDNGQYLSSLLRQIPGIAPAKHYAGTTMNAFHLYMFRYDPDQFAGLPRAKFLKALSAEGVGCSGGYGMLNKDQFIKNRLASRAYKAVYPKKVLAEWEERTRCPENDKLCEEAVWFTQTTLLGTRKDMEEIATAIGKIHAHAAELVKA